MRSIITHQFDCQRITEKLEVIKKINDESGKALIIQFKR
ncbi:hypothetical protein PPEP_a0903 [Pseudoalteromonas peptidolytica F12-50-A1]|uniref:Uncharacterized protein n=1 Tax=Pseudoalteromonas peptidolytica F12-50-A1 TaxID=1315280 RepID=A0A8I0MU41_9GAMM|nr:hypothetical protein [Pseudoalteromonas peptidolytica F12-50-A1]